MELLTHLPPTIAGMVVLYLMATKMSDTFARALRAERRARHRDTKRILERLPPCSK